MIEFLLGLAIFALVFVLFRCIETWHDINLDD